MTFQLSLNSDLITETFTQFFYPWQMFYNTFNRDIVSAAAVARR